MNQETQNQKMSQILARCWSDAAFKASLLADPVAVLKAQGVELPAGVQVRVVEDTDQVAHWVLPARPDALSDADLDTVAGGGSQNLPLLGIDPRNPFFAAFLIRSK